MKNPLKNTEPVKIKHKTKPIGWIKHRMYGNMKVWGESKKYYHGEIIGGHWNKMGLAVLKSEYKRFYKKLK